MEKLELEVGLVDLKFWLLFQKNSEQIWDKECDWFLRVNHLFDEVFKSSSVEGHYKYNIIRGDWKHNFAEHYKSQMCTIRRLKKIMEIVRNRPSRVIRDKAQIYMNKLLDMKDDFR